MSEPSVVEVRTVNKHFGDGPTRVDALRDVSLDVFPGTVVGLRGPSGSGKSTLLNVIGCILEPNSGSMRLNGELVYDGRWLRSDLRRLRLEKIGFIFQAHNLLPFLNAWENVAVAQILAGVAAAQAKQRALELLDYLGVERRKRRDAGTAFGRRSAAHRDRTGAVERSSHHSRRRADGGARFPACGYRDGSLEEGRLRAANGRYRGDARRKNIQSLRPHLFVTRWCARSHGPPGRVAASISSQSFSRNHRRACEAIATAIDLCQRRNATEAQT